MEENFCLAFSLSPAVGPKGFQRLLKIYGSAKDAWEKSSAEKYKEAGIGELNYAKFANFKKGFDIQEYLNKLRKTKVEFIPFNNKYYPERLGRIDSPPIGLFTRGNKKLLLEENTIGVVGARKMTSYGVAVTESLVTELCSAGFVIVSGMALGVDGVSHKTAIECQGPSLPKRGNTIAVLGCGVDCPFPRENEKLYEEILDSNGLIISEYPLGMPPNQGTFPARNRVIAGVSIAVLITEAGDASGSLITAEEARKQGKTVFAVPGPITSQMSKGTLKLLKHGAVLVSSGGDILEAFQVKSQKSKIKSSIQNSKILTLSTEGRKIVEILENEQLTIDEIAKLSNMRIDKLSTILSEMELKGLIKNSGGKFIVRE